MRIWQTARSASLEEVDGLVLVTGQGGVALAGTCSLGREPSSRGVTPSQKVLSCTVSRAMSHSVPMASTSAMNFWSSPRRLTCTCATQLVSGA